MKLASHILRTGLLGALLPWALPGCGPASDPVVLVVAFGDSSTSGPAESDYIDFLPDIWEVSADLLVNEGNGGEVTAEGLDRLATLLDQQWYPNARLLLYWEGGNDIVDFVTAFDPLLLSSPNSESYPYEAELQALMDGVQANIEAVIQMGREANLEIIVATYFFLPEFSLSCDPLLLDVLLPFQATHANEYTEMLNERIRDAADLQNAGLVDVAALDAVLRADPQNYENCNHLSAQGNALVAGLFGDAGANMFDPE